MRIKETALGFWECPDCFCKNSVFLVEGELLPNELDCDFCCHKSGEIEWTKQENDIEKEKLQMHEMWSENCYSQS